MFLSRMQIFSGITHIWRQSRPPDKRVNEGRICRFSPNTADNIGAILNFWQNSDLAFLPLFVFFLFLGMWPAWSVYILSPKSDIYLAVG